MSTFYASKTLTAIEEEEKEALERDANKDCLSFRDSCLLIRTKLEEMRVIRKNGQNVKDNYEWNDLKTDIAMVFLDLKKLNRFDKMRIKNARDQVAEGRQKVDSFHLQLQNLMYEVYHLQKEINKCLDFRSKDETIDLVSVEQFFREAPSSCIEPIGEPPYDDHTLTLARLQWELLQRKELSQKLEERKNARDKIASNIEGEKEKLESVRPILSKVIEASQPLSELLGSSLEIRSNQHQNASYLSRPLYVIYVNAWAMKEAYRESFLISIEGNIEEAKAEQFLNPFDVEESAESDGEDRKGKRHRKSKSNRKENILKRAIQHHPLTLKITFHIENSKLELVLEFFHIINLKIVTVKTNVFMPTDTGHSELLDETLLTNLFPSDNGLSSPNPSNDFLLESLRLDKFSQLVRRIGYAYKWAQSLAGLHLLSKEIKDPEDCIPTFTKVVEAIKHRFKSRVFLLKAILDLEKGAISLPDCINSFVFPKLYCFITDWKISSFLEWKETETGRALFDKQAVKEDDLFYKVMIERRSAHLKVLIAIPSNYPVESPVFQLLLNWSSEKTSSSDDCIRELESYINLKAWQLIGNESDKHHMLTLMIHTLCVGFDSILEADQALFGADGPLEFQQGRLFRYYRRGRDHSKPFLFNHEHQVFV